ncbi:MAG: hypothetical protein A3C90_03760 [Candidatus Magasanikbacteria bacterium RIFCSPHIGHO2_02_FULL_51_14]|uniref:Thymidylate kinase-like domain-containing protein n=1 Tax=Candidatus Magasanikbacteria bacterium RIFCSPHIGHO2_02_FULL_51_14 TaxID=1798683 RepID=A0A1F6MQG2_9BACT|nr:MAG: hypothetical protein A3C90_03760 [Candidatus Magasanikbacteria bacterium RIFCSPHIGHO2_02_FULL_51_14]
MQKGKLIVLYGINNLGKTTQATLLVERLNKEGHRAEYLKYPLYDLAPSGPLISGYLRGGNPHQFTPRESQLLNVLNRTQFDARLRQKIADGTLVVAEDYIGTGIAWGMGAGVDGSLLKKWNEHLVKEDLAFLFTGKRFTEATEANHRHETDEALLARVEKAHEELAGENGWIFIAANRSIEEIHEDIRATVGKLL